MKSHVHNISRGLWIHYNVLWSYEFTSNLLGNNEQYFKRPDKYKRCSSIHG